MHTPLFETERLVVRHFCPDDLDVFAALIADSVVMRYIGEGITLSREDTAYWIGVCQKKYADRGYGTSAVFHKDGSFLGYCGVIRAPDRDFDELTYTLHRHAWGTGVCNGSGRGNADLCVWANFARPYLCHSLSR